MSNPTSDLKTILSQVNNLQHLLSKLLLKYKKATHAIANYELLFQQARLAIGRDASPLDLVNDELGCAESVSVLISKIRKFPIITGTWSLNHRLKNDSRFIMVNENSGRGTIVICATGTGNGRIRGHVGILADKQLIMSARSSDGKWGVFYNLDTWKKRWQAYGGFPIHYYKIL